MKVLWSLLFSQVQNLESLDYNNSCLQLFPTLSCRQHNHNKLPGWTHPSERRHTQHPVLTAMIDQYLHLRNCRITPWLCLFLFRQPYSVRTDRAPSSAWKHPCLSLTPSAEKSFVDLFQNLPVPYPGKS